MSERLTDGFSTTIAFSAGTSGVTLKLWEKDVTPPGVDGGGANDTTTMRNTTWKTRMPKGLKTLTEASFKAQYDPEVLDEILAMINVNQEIVITYPDLSTLTFWGWLDSWKPGALNEGEAPLADGVIIPSNMDGISNEIAPVYADAT